MATSITKNFTFEELEKSATATALGIKNEIPRKYIMNAVRLCDRILQPIRDAWNEPIIITSGYRCAEVNKCVGGVSNSQHMTAAAVDIKTAKGTPAENKKLWNNIMTLVKLEIITARQIIWEHGEYERGPAWIHIAINTKEHSEKKNEIIYNY